jgi:hypothetical protein
MPKIQVLSERNDFGAKSLDFSMDGKRYVALPKIDADQSWLNEFKDLLNLSSKYNLNPFATPVKYDPDKSEKYKGRRSYDEIKYSWNVDDTIQGTPRQGLKKYIDVVPKDKLNEYFEQRTPGAVQTKMVLSKVAEKLKDKGLREAAERVSRIKDRL